MYVLAAGLNAHGQLGEQSQISIKSFTPIRPTASKIILSTWSTLTVQQDGHLITTGHQHWQQKLETSLTDACFIGDHNGLLGAVDSSGHLWLVKQSSSTDLALHSMQHEKCPTIAHIAMTGTGRVACIKSQTSDDNLTHIREFDTFEAFKDWYCDSANEYDAAVHYTVTGCPKQLAAGTGSFGLLMEDNNLYTWGDPRHESLARSTLGEGAVSAHIPGLVESLAGLQLHKVALGGWLGGAVSVDGAAYCWGASMPGKDHELEMLRTMPSGDRVALVSLGIESEEPDVIDIAIGDGHGALLTADNRAFVVGENSHGQLGIDGDESFISSWREVSGVSAVAAIRCGPKSTFLLLEGMPE